MKNLYLVLALLFALSACSIGQKCTYTQDGTKISSWFWITKEVPVDLSKNNCNCHCDGDIHGDVYGPCTCENCKCREVKDEPEGLVVDETGQSETCQ